MNFGIPLDPAQKVHTTKHLTLQEIQHALVQAVIDKLPLQPGVIWDKSR